MSEPRWTLEGYDTFSRESHRLPGSWATEAEALAAARARLGALERDQPTATSGGQQGVQDRVFVVRPDGSKYRVVP